MTVYILIFAAVYLALVLAGHWFFSLTALRSRSKEPILRRAWAENRHNPYREAEEAPWFSGLNGAEPWKERLRRRELCAWFLEQQRPTHRYALCCHDYATDARYTASYARGLYQRGFHVLMPDAAACGASEGRILGLGFGEREEVRVWVERILERDLVAEIVLFGLGTGAASELFYCCESPAPRVRGVISDSAYAGLWEVLLAHLMPRLGAVAKTVIGFANTENMLFGGVHLHWKKGNLWQRVGKCAVPVLLMHGEEDYLFPVKHFEVLQEQITAPLHTLRLPGAGHIALLAEDPARYWTAVDEFLGSIGENGDTDPL